MLIKDSSTADESLQSDFGFGFGYGVIFATSLTCVVLRSIYSVSEAMS
jgi:hypothetical protein